VAGDRWNSLPRPCDRLVDGISKRNHRVRFAGHGAVRLADLNQNDIWAERMVRTLLREWAYARPYTDTAERVAGLGRFLDFYNRERPHWSLAGQPPISRTPVNNLDGKNS
jgi:transposase InsO family protein